MHDALLNLRFTSLVVRVGSAVLGRIVTMRPTSLRLAAPRYFSGSFLALRLGPRSCSRRQPPPPPAARPHPAQYYARKRIRRDGHLSLVHR
ncbi:hypothetical protein HYPSUDRAFT_42748 [Hypholoma sublateritium FD-334 SS-4]|uniref:Uncharacterized protein n=1 Tax=Hypholoma sublateritium (strain FD-334 SS-4) TaxID=945553 RepID=A0A0D2L2H0_HYPSF|nr:hypothetical protein HYPSUDRAFT_42748 [Hypholoma sublateritium FD-334 SS-4]